MIYLEKIKQYATSNGVSDFLLGNEVLNPLEYQTFEDIEVPSGTEVDYLATDVKFDQWETGFGIYGNAGTFQLTTNPPDIIRYISIVYNNGDYIFTEDGTASVYHYPEFLTSDMKGLGSWNISFEWKGIGPHPRSCYFWWWANADGVDLHLYNDGTISGPTSYYGTDFIPSNFETLNMDDGFQRVSFDVQRLFVAPVDDAWEGELWCGFYLGDGHTFIYQGLNDGSGIEVRNIQFVQNPSLTRVNVDYSSDGEKTKVNFTNPPLISVNPIGIHRSTTQPVTDSSDKIATTAFVENNYAPLISAELTGTPIAPTATSGDSSTQIATTAFVQGELNKSAFGQCRLYRSATSTLLLLPWDGNRILLNGVLRIIPSTGVSYTLSGLSIGNNYNVFAYWTGSAIALEVISTTTTHVTDSTYGIQVKDGDASRTLVGKIRAISANDTADSETQRFVINWYNREPKFLWKSTADTTTTSTNLVELDTNSRPAFICWYNTIVWVTFFGYGWISGGDGSDFFFAEGRVDSTGAGGSYATIYDTGNGDAWSHHIWYSSLSSGYHYLSGWGAVNASGFTAHYGAGSGCHPALVGWYIG